MGVGVADGVGVSVGIGVGVGVPPVLDATKRLTSVTLLNVPAVLPCPTYRT